MRWLTCLILGISSVSLGYDRTPSPNFSPTEVVNIVLGGMANNDSPTPDAGLQQAFQFASPSNKKATGPFWHFKAIVEQPAYAPLINHASRTLGEPRFTGKNAATVPLVVIGTNGEVAGYLWSLSRQIGGDHIGSWLTDSVVRVPLGSKLNAL